MKVRDVVRLIEDDGRYLVATRGSHRQFKHPTRPGRVTVAGKPSDESCARHIGQYLEAVGP
jgi:predicted RNA binding protein YcfA (HicA-like mRNA interferase family)